MDENITRVCINISGTKYEVDHQMFNKMPDTKLAKLTKSPNFGKTSSLYFDRPASMFETILTYYQTGELHIPGHVCPKAFQTELRFWEIDPSCMERCCMYKYMTFMDDMDNRDAFYASMVSTNVQSGNNDFIWSKMKRRVWSVLDHRENSIIGKVYFGLVIIFVLLSIFSLALSTIPVFKEPLKTCEIKEYMEENDYYIPLYFFNFLNTQDCQSSRQETMENFIDYLYPDFDDYDGDSDEKNDKINKTAKSAMNDPGKNENKRNVSANDTKHYKNITVPDRLKRNEIFESIDFAVTSFFTVELIFRIFSCPSLKTYFKSILNILETLVLLASYAHLILESSFAKLRYETKGFEILLYLQMLRVIRLFRVMQRITAIKVLIHSVRTGYKDLIVLMLYLFIGIIVFANFAYFAEETENFPSIPQAWWWGMVTMTTVGYGDIAPKSVIGKLIASTCILTGIILMSLVIPLFVNTFVQLYQFARIQNKLQENKKYNKETKSSVETSLEIKNVV